MASSFHRVCLSALVAACLAYSAANRPAAAKDDARIALQHFDGAEEQKSAWGWIRWVMSSKVDPNSEMTMGIVRIAPHQANPLHVHPNCAECLHVLEGSCEHRVGDQWVRMQAGDTLRIPKGVPHMARTSKEACRAVVVYDTGRREMVVLEQKD